MALHKDLPSAELHEAKGIITAATSDAGKILTPSAVTAGTSELRYLKEPEVKEKYAYISLYFPDVANKSDMFLPMNFAGTVKNVKCIIDGTITTADTILTVKVGTTAMTNGTITITASGSAAGDIDSCTPTALNTFTASSYLRVTSDTAGAGTVNATLLFTIERA
jgi:hypothetical protein